MTRSLPLAVVGNVNVDLVMGPAQPWPRPGSEVIMDHDDLRPGGAAGNAGLAWAAMGRDFQMAAHTGDDAFGSWLRAAFPVHSARWPVAPGGTTLSVGLTHPDGERTFFTTRGHLAALTWPQVRDMLDWPRLAGGHLLLCGCFLMDALARDYDQLFDHADRHGISVALDTGWPVQGWTGDIRARALDWIRRCRFLLLNAAEASALSGLSDPLAAALHLQSLMPKGAAVAVKRGAGGVLGLDPTGTPHEVPAPPVQVIDTIGAGDVFDAAFLARIAEGGTLPDALAFAVSTASLAVSTHPRRYS